MKRIACAVATMTTIVVAIGCSAKYVRTAAPGDSLDEWLDAPRRIMWVAAHPDDEGFAGPILAKAGRKSGGAVHFVVLTDAAGGECCIPGGCVPDLATVRATEIAASARLYGATLKHAPYWNAPLPGSSFPPRHEIAKRWMSQGDPTLLIAKEIREFRPDAILTLSPGRGGTGHPEHQLSARFALAAARLAATDTKELPGAPHRVERVYWVLSKLWLAEALGSADPEEPTEIFDIHQPCFQGRSCVDVAAQITRVHQSQANDMKGMRLLFKQLDELPLRRVNPEAELLDPMEPVGKGGMNTNP
ncbi:MAG: PIG-L family deacetylase [Deltaproteobacteria bacterium]|nr:PIG-L family deacetylase [Deltaproteobacteria bacterium]